jgi:hypothetical protein
MQSKVFVRRSNVAIGSTFFEQHRSCDSTEVCRASDSQNMYPRAFPTYALSQEGPVDMFEASLDSVFYFTICAVVPREHSPNA